MDPQGIQYSQIEGYDYSNLDSLKKVLKIKALHAAKDKALYLSESIDKNLGEAIEVSEINEYLNMNRQMNTGNAPVIEELSAQTSMSTVEFKTIKLSYHIRAVFQME